MLQWFYSFISFNWKFGQLRILMKNNCPKEFERHCSPYSSIWGYRVSAIMNLMPFWFLFFVHDRADTVSAHLYPLYKPCPCVPEASYCKCPWPSAWGLSRAWGDWSIPGLGHGEVPGSFNAFRVALNQWWRSWWLMPFVLGVYTEVCLHCLPKVPCGIEPQLPTV